MKKDTTKKPFFARLLEEQELDAVKGGNTQKYPSDAEDHGSIDTSVVKQPEHTMKAPSDSDEAF